MQEISGLLKSLNELEFLVAYQRHVISSRNCGCGMPAMSELYRLYSNMKNLSSGIKSGLWKLYNENIRLRETNEFLSRLWTEDDFSQVIRYTSLIDHCDQRILSLRNQKQMLVKSNDRTMTIAQAIEETESELAKKRPFNYLHNKINSLNDEETEFVSSSTTSSSSSSFLTSSHSNIKLHHRQQFQSQQQDFQRTEFKPISSPNFSSSTTLSTFSPSNLVTYNNQVRPRLKKPYRFKSYDNLNYSDHFTNLKTNYVSVTKKNSLF